MHLKIGTNQAPTASDGGMDDNEREAIRAVIADTSRSSKTPTTVEAWDSA
jgi:hypothetical protein